VQAAIAQLERRALAGGRAFEPITVDVNENATVANITVPIAGNGTDAASNAAFRVLRKTIVPETVGALPDTEAARERPHRCEKELARLLLDLGALDPGPGLDRSIVANAVAAPRTAHPFVDALARQVALIDLQRWCTVDARGQFAEQILPFDLNVVVVRHR
jgi:hypothetical protein